MDYIKIFDECNQDLGVFIDKIIEIDAENEIFRKYGERHGYTYSMNECLRMEDKQAAQKKFKKPKSISLMHAISVFKNELPIMMKVSEAYGEEEKWKEAKEILDTLNNYDMHNIEVAKEKIMEDVLRANGIEFRSGRCKCPLCDSNNSTTFTFKDNIYFCFKCNKTGDSINFVQEYLKLNFKESINYLKSL